MRGDLKCECRQCNAALPRGFRFYCPECTKTPPGGHAASPGRPVEQVSEPLPYAVGFSDLPVAVLVPENIGFIDPLTGE